jgi:hypothetical protein
MRVMSFATNIPESAGPEHWAGRLCHYSPECVEGALQHHLCGTTCENTARRAHIEERRVLKILKTG